MMTMLHEELGCRCVTADVGCAYLNAHMPKHDPDKLVFIKIAADITSILVEVDPRMALFIPKDGSLIAELNKALYGCPMVRRTHLYFAFNF